MASSVSTCEVIVYVYRDAKPKVIRVVATIGVIAVTLIASMVVGHYARAVVTPQFNVLDVFIGFGYLLVCTGTLLFIIGCAAIILGEFYVKVSAAVAAASIAIALLASSAIPSNPPTVPVQVFCGLFMQLMVWIVIVFIRGVAIGVRGLHCRCTMYVEGVRNDIVLNNKLADSVSV